MKIYEISLLIVIIQPHFWSGDNIHFFGMLKVSDNRGIR